MSSTKGLKKRVQGQVGTDCNLIKKENTLIIIHTLILRYTLVYSKRERDREKSAARITVRQGQWQGVEDTAKPRANLVEV